MPFDLPRFQTRVQHNCHIADASHAGDYTLCVYLMKMRELYRWEKGYGFGDPLPGEAVGDWLREREALWERIEDEGFAPLPLDGREYDPFDADAVNAHLLDHGLVYSAGIGHNGKPHFFLGELEHAEERPRFRLMIAGTELARDLTAPPAMTRGGTIFVRRESLRRLIWEKLEEWRWNRLDNPMGRAIRCYDFENDLEGALHAMADNEIETMLLHEMGEVEAGERLGEGWESMLADLPRSRLELQLRAVRDHLADALSTLPALLERGADASLHFYFATLTPLRRDMAPRLMAAYRDWHASGDTRAFADYLDRAVPHWQGLAESLLAHHAAHGLAGGEAAMRLIDDNPL